MATITSTASGNWSAGGTWVGGVAPVDGDKVIIAHTSTGLNQFSTNTAGYGIGATAITLTGAVAAGSYVIGESVQFAGDPNYYTITNWVAGTKVLTVTALIVAIPAAATLVSTRGHVVTIDGVVAGGDDSVTATIPNAAINVSGTIKASRTANCSLTSKGLILINSQTNGCVDYGTTGDPITNTYTADLILNKATTPAIRTGLQFTTPTAVGNAPILVGCGGRTRTRIQSLSAGISAGATSITLNSAAHGWAVGDDILLLATTNGAVVDQCEVKTITSVAGAVIGFSATTYAHTANSWVGNMTSNVTFKPYNNTNAQQSMIGVNTNHSSGPVFTLSFTDVVFKNLGRATNEAVFNMTVGHVNNNLIVDSCAHYSTLTTGTPFINGNVFGVKSTVDDSVFYTGWGANTGTLTTANNCIVRADSMTVVGSAITNCWFVCTPGLNGVRGAGYYTDCIISGIGRSVNQPAVTGGLLTMDNCDCGYTYGYAPEFAGDYLYRINGLYNTFIRHTLKDCLLDTTWQTPDDVADLVPQLDIYTQFINKGRDVTVQEIWTHIGKIERDNSTTKHGTSSKKLTPHNVAANLSRVLSSTQQIFCADGDTLTIAGSVQATTAFYNGGTWTAPTVTISGLGITPQVFTASAAANNAWEDYLLSATNSAGYDGNFTVTFTAALQTATGGSVYFDGLADSPFITKARHYGYLIEEGNPARTTDPYSPMTEASAAALTGITINGAANTVVVSTDHSVDDLYAYCQYWGCQAANLGYDVPLTTTDGVTYTSTFDWTVNASVDITGTGELNLGSGTLSVGASATSTVPWTYSSGAGAWNLITVTGYTVGYRIRLYNVDTTTELYNDIPAGATLNVNAIWTVDQTVNLRAAYTVGAAADKLVNTAAILGVGGASFLIIPEADPVYNLNAIDGSTVTEFAADYPNVQIDVSDGDGITTPQRGYAWYMAGQMTSDGVANFHGALVADDIFNYMIDVAVADMKVQNVSASPCIIAGARLYRSDGTTIFAAGSGPIQHDPDKAYSAGGTADEIAVAVLGNPKALTVGKFLALK